MLVGLTPAIIPEDAECLDRMFEMACRHLLFGSMEQRTGECNEAFRFGTAVGNAWRGFGHDQVRGSKGKLIR